MITNLISEIMQSFDTLFIFSAQRSQAEDEVRFQPRSQTTFHYNLTDSVNA